MIDAAVIALAIALAGAIGAFVWFAARESSSVHNEADARVAQTATEGALERSQFELETTKKALAAATMRCAALQGVLDDVQAKLAAGDGVAPGDLHGRLELFRAWEAAASARNDIPTKPSSAVPQQATAGDAAAKPG